MLEYSKILFINKKKPLEQTQFQKFGPVTLFSKICFAQDIKRFLLTQLRPLQIFQYAKIPKFVFESKQSL